jgi:hypothetical protein
MDYDEAQKYASLYGFQALFAAQQHKALDLVAEASALITPSFDPTKANQQDVRRFREQVMRLQANLLVTDQLGTQLLKAYREFLRK